jgi:hypothetical protein
MTLQDREFVIRSIDSSKGKFLIVSIRVRVRGATSGGAGLDVLACCVLSSSDVVRGVLVLAA